VPATSGIACLPHGEFQTLFNEEHRNWCGFSWPKATKLMIVARSDRLLNYSPAKNLPCSYDTLYELTTLPDSLFDALLARGAIKPGMDRKRRIGQLSRELVASEGGRPSKTLPMAGKSFKSATLKAAGISTSEAHRCELLAAVGRYSFATFEEYVEVRFDLAKDRVEQIIRASVAVENLPTIVGTLPSRESHVRPLLKLESDAERASAWRSESGKMPFHSSPRLTDARSRWTRRHSNPPPAT